MYRIIRKQKKFNILPQKPYLIHWNKIIVYNNCKPHLATGELQTTFDHRGEIGYEMWWFDDKLLMSV